MKFANSFGLLLHLLFEIFLYVSLFNDTFVIYKFFHLGKLYLGQPHKHA